MVFFLFLPLRLLLYLTISINVCSNRFDAVPKLNFNKGNYSDLRDYLDINWDLLLKPYTEDVETGE